MDAVVAEVIERARAAHAARQVEEEEEEARLEALIRQELRERVSMLCGVPHEAIRIMDWTAPTNEVFPFAELGHLSFMLLEREPTEEEEEAIEQGEPEPPAGFFDLVLVQACTNPDCGSYDGSPPLLELADLGEQLESFKIFYGWCPHRPGGSDDEDDDDTGGGDGDIDGPRMHLGIVGPFRIERL